jgi:hypothetical protein
MSQEFCILCPIPMLVNTFLKAWKAARVSAETVSLSLHVSRGPSGLGVAGVSDPGHRPLASALGFTLPARWAGGTSTEPLRRAMDSFRRATESFRREKS